MRLFVISIFLFVGFVQLQAQTFKGGLVLGMNASQVTGDSLSGYYKLGISGGVTVGISLSERFDLFTEFLFSQKGSTQNFGFVPKENDRRINLNYLEIPFMLHIKDWYIEEGDYYKVRAELGLSYGNLFLSRIDNSESLESIADQFRRHDVSLILGGGIALNEHFEFSIRYSRSLIKLYYKEEVQPDELQALLSYLITFRAGYIF